MNGAHVRLLELGVTHSFLRVTPYLFPDSFAGRLLIVNVVERVRMVLLDAIHHRPVGLDLVVLAAHRTAVAPSLRRFDVDPDACGAVCHSPLFRGNPRRIVAFLLQRCYRKPQIIDPESAGAGRGSRTPKGRSPADFESAASASSAIPALSWKCLILRLISHSMSFSST